MTSTDRQARLDEISRDMAKAAALTRTQRAALADLLTTGRQWPMGRGRLRGDAPNEFVRYSQRTLQALVDAGLARWARHYHGVMPHVVPTTTEEN